VAVLTAVSVAAVWWCASLGYTLYYGDAEAHLNIARRVLDSRTPGPEQLGTVWLPLPHLLMLPFVVRDAWWWSGIAGAIPAAACFVAAGTFLFAAARMAFSSQAAGWAAGAIFALNPNMLYLQATPMTEPMFAAALAALLWATVGFRQSQSLAMVLAAAAASVAASLTRYEGWFLVPFTVVYLLFTARKKWHVVVFTLLASLGPLAWLAHNQYYYSNPLEFYNGEYSAVAIYHRQLAQGMTRYPGDHEWVKAARYYIAAMNLTIGWPALGFGAVGAIIALVRRVWWPLVLLMLPPVFYVWSVYSSGTPIYVPNLWPNAWYNTRYGLAALPLVAFAGASIVTLLPKKWQAVSVASIAVVVGGLAMLAGPAACWTESEVNSAARRTWTREAAALLQAQYRPGSSLIYSFGDLTGVLRQAHIPLVAGRHEGNRPYWDAAAQRPEIFLRDEWALVSSGDKIATAIVRTGRLGPHYELRGQFIVKGAPVIELYRRSIRKPQ